MLESHTRKDIEKISYDILKSSKSFDIFPTPVDRIVTYAELEFDHTLDVSKIHHNYLSKVSDALRSGLSKIRGILDRSEKKIYLDLEQSNSRKNFVKLHEVGHDVLNWQNHTHDCLEDDNTLSAETKEEFEAEANYFASLTLFQHDRFLQEIEKLELSIKSSMHLAKLFGSSVHAALRNYVILSKNRCALIVLEKMHSDISMPKYLLRNYFQSVKFSKSFGEIIWLKEMSYTLPFVQDYHNNKKFKVDGEITLNSENGVVNYTYHFFNNTYNAFVFLFPKTELKKAKTKIIFSDNTNKILSI